MSSCHIFHVQLEDIATAIWRRLEIRGDKNFWDLHCAIEDAMPWEDRHLHEFRFPIGDQESWIGWGSWTYLPAQEPLQIHRDGGLLT